MLRLTRKGGTEFRFRPLFNYLVIDLLQNINII